MELIFISYLPSIVGLYLVGLAIYFNNPNSPINKFFTAFVFSSATWQLFLLLGDLTSDPAQALLMLRIAIAVGTPFGLFFLVFCDIFPSIELRKISNRTWVILSVINIIFCGLSLTPYMVHSIIRNDGGIDIGDATFLYSLQSIVIIVEMFWGIVTVVRKRNTSDSVHRAQIRMIAFGAFVATLVNAVTGFVLVLLNVSGVLLTPLAGLSFLTVSIFAWIAMTRYSMFQVRSVVARAVAYAVTGVVLIGLYVLLVGIGIDMYVKDKSARLLLTTISIVILLNVFNKLRRFFNHYTNRLFYHEAYSSRDRLDALTEKLVSHIELDQVVRESADILQSTLSPTKLYIAIGDGGDRKIYGTPSKSELKQLTRLIQNGEWKRQKGSDGIIFIQDTSQSVQEMMRNISIEALVPLRSVNRYEGCIILGARSSGGLYTWQDNAFLRIAARNIGLAVNNAISFKEIRDFNKTLSTQVVAATQELRKKNKELESLHKTKDDIISMASHQLRPKITASQGFLDLLQRSGLKTTTEQSELLNLAQEGISRMGDIVVDMLDVSHIEMLNLKLDLSVRKVNIARLLKDEVRVQSAHQKERFSLKIDRNSTNTALYVDVVKMREVIGNLLSNADQYSPKDKLVTVRLTAKNGWVAVLVTDQGIGISKEEQAKLFDKFYRSPAAKSLRPQGTGLGLYMVKAVVEAHSGRIIVDSTPAKGTTIGFELPLS